MGMFTRLLYDNGILKPATAMSPITTGYGNTLYTHSGGMVTIWRIDGAMRRHSGEQRDRLMRRLDTALATWNKKSGTYISFIHEHDASRVAAELAQNHAPMRKTMNRFGMLEANHLLDSREQMLGPSLQHDALYFVIHTTTGVMSAKARKANKQTWGFRMGQGGSFYEEVVDSHQATVQVFKRIFKELSLLHAELSAREGAALISTQWTRHEAPPGRFSLLGDSINAMVDTMVYRKTKQGYAPVIRGEPATMLRLTEQIFSDKIFYPTDRDDSFMLGDHHQCVLRLTKSPSGASMEGYNALRKLIPREVGYRMTMQIASGTGSMNALGFKRIVSMIMAMTQPRNVDIARSIESLQALEKAGYDHLSMKVSVVTWAKERRLLERNVDALHTAFGSWGGAALTRMVEAPDMVAAETLPGGIMKGPSCFMPVGMMSEIMPLEITTSPWRQGLLLRSDENQPYPLDPGDGSLINFHVYVLIGGTGRGKSVTMTDIIKSLLFRAGLDELPEIRYLDVGYTSKAMFTYLRYMLPDDKRDQIVHYVMQNTAEYATNPFDTPLGMRNQAPMERSFLSDFLEDILVGDSPNMDAPTQQLLGGLAIMMVSESYRMMSDDGELVKTYFDISDRYPALEQALRQHNITAVPGGTPWWSIVDALYEAGEIKLAEIAQRYGVPNFSDMSSVITSSTSIQEGFGDISPNGMPLLKYAKVLLQTLTANYPVLASETRLDIQQARVVALDMQDVANSVEDTNLFYSLAQNVLSRGFMTDPDEIARLDMPRQYREYHRNRIRALRAREKIFAFDELHRLSMGLSPTAPPPPAMARLMRWIKEVRKYQIKLLLSSQAVTHMPDEIKEDGMWSLMFNMGVGENQQKRVSELFGLSEYGREVMREELNGPEAGVGAPCLFMANTNQGLLEQKVYISTSPMELWAAPTNQENLSLLQSVLEHVGDPILSARALTELFPNGTAERDIDRLCKDRDLTKNQAVDVLIKRVNERAKELQSKAAA